MLGARHQSCRTAAGRHTATYRTAARLASAQRCQRRHVCVVANSHSRWASIDAEEARRLVDREGYKILDVRSARDYDYGHITKPARCSMNAPVVQNDGQTWNQDFATAVACQAPKSAKLLVMCVDGGALSDAALQQMSEAGYTGALLLEGGYQGWGQVWSPSGKRRPPPGRWVSTGKEALKSGLNIPGVADSYDEGGNLAKAKFAEGLKDGETLLPPIWRPDQRQ